MLFRKMTIAGYAWLHDLDIQRDSKNSKVFLKHKKRKGKKTMHPNRSLSLGGGRGRGSNSDDTRALRRPDPELTHGDSEGGSLSRGLQRSGTWRSTAVPS